jgi:hypothetical protein
VIAPPRENKTSPELTAASSNMASAKCERRAVKLPSPLSTKQAFARARAEEGDQ